MKWFFGLAVVIMVLAVCVSVCQGQEITGGHYFGQDPPGFSPVVFAPGIISQANRYEYCLVFSPNLDECVFGSTNSAWSGFTLWYTKMGSDSTWTDPAAAPFQGNGDGFVPTFSADGNEVYFVSSRPSDPPPLNMWRSSREGAGWSEPLDLGAPINSASSEWGGTLTDDGTLYFSSTRPGGLGGGDIYRAVTSPGGEITVENLGATVNGPQPEGSPCIARDGSYLIFESQRPGGYGHSDLYITTREDDAWTWPRNLGPVINTSGFDDGASISPDGKYLFFNRRSASVTGTQTEIWWVDARAVFNPEQSGVKDTGACTGGLSFLRNEPNPFGPSTTIRYSTPVAGFVAVKVYDALGREVRSLVNKVLASGAHSVEFDAPIGGRLADGVYYYSLLVGDRRLGSTKMVSLR